MVILKGGMFIHRAKKFCLPKEATQAYSVILLRILLRVLQWTVGSWNILFLTIYSLSSADNKTFYNEKGKVCFKVFGFLHNDFTTEASEHG